MRIARAFSLCSALTILTTSRAAAQTAVAGKVQYEKYCVSCHGMNGEGGMVSTNMASRLSTHDDAALTALVRAGISGRGMPAFQQIPDSELRSLVAYLRSLQPTRAARGGRGGGRGSDAPALTIETTAGQKIEGRIVNQSFEDLQLRTADDRVHLYRRQGDRFRPVTSQTDWPSYDGNTRGYRYSTLAQITKTNVARLAPKWVYSFAETSPLETTPVVVEGIMYVTSGNQLAALDAGSGRQIWIFRRTRTQGVVGNASGGISRGVAVDSARVYMETDNAHLVALDRFTGDVLWETALADSRENYSATAAPMVVAGLVIAGIAGGDAGARGFLGAYDRNTGKEVWRFWTTPNPGEPGSETWQGKAIEHPGAVTWMSGSYDAATQTLYWATGNPGSDHNGDVRLGDNLYSDCVLALDVHTGKLKWYYQFTPHDLWDWDAQEPLALIDAAWQGQPRKLLVQANRNGFFYVLDRTNGKLLLGRPFVQHVTWAKGIDANGRPIKNPNQEPMEERPGTFVCPSLIGGSNWWSTSYNPTTGLYYVQTLESCSNYTKRDDDWKPGAVYMGGGSSTAPDPKPLKILRAIDVKTGDVKWELPQIGAGATRAGTLATSTGLVFFGEDSGALMAVDAVTGKPLWHFQTSQTLRASPMTYQFDGKQYVVLAAGANIMAFGLPDAAR